MNNRPTPQSWIPYAGLLLAVAGIVYQSGQLTGDVRRNTERIGALEAALSARAVDINTINVRTARIEAKVDLLVPQARPIAP